MEGDALAWCQWEEGRRPFRGWEEFKEAIVARFQSSQEGSLQEQLLSLQQTTSVKEFRRHFEVFSAPLKGLPDVVLEAAFVNGLRADIQAEIRQVNPIEPATKMILARRIEDKLLALESYKLISSQR